MATIPTQEQFQKDLDIATSEGTPHYNWLPPEWIDTKPDLNADNNIANAPSYKKPTALNCVVALEERINQLKDKFPDSLGHVKANRAAETGVGKDEEDDLTQMPHPGSDFGHVDPGVYSEDQRNSFKNAFKAVRDLRGVATKDGEMTRVINQALPVMDRADGLLKTNAKGMQRLKLAFEYTLCHVTTVFGEINAALANSNEAEGKKDYTAARQKYIDLLRDLDNHEPKEGDITPGQKGYGRTLKWIYVRPLIHAGKIKGATVIAKWNPHISSSGVPIPHP